MEITRLIQRCRQGDTAALGELYRSYAKELSGVCRRYFSDKQAINDVLHDSFVIIFTSLDKLHDDSKAETWMRSITRNVASNYKKFQKKHRTVPFNETSGTASFEDDFLEKTKELSMDELMALIDKLPEGYGKVFRLAVFEGLSHNEIAAMLNIEPHSSSSQLARAKKMLRKMIQQYWAVLLLFLIPVALLLLRKENPAINGETPVVVNHSDTPVTQPTEQNPEPEVVVQQPTNKTTDHAKVTQRSAVDTPVDYALIDTSATVVAQDATAPDTSLNGQPSDTIQFIQKMVETPYYDRTNLFPEKITPKHNTTQLWAVGFAYTGSINEQKTTTQLIIQRGSGSGGVIRPIPTGKKLYDTILCTNYHYMPIELTMTAFYKLNNQFSVGTGLNYIRLISDFDIDSIHSIGREPLQTIHYFGIPIKGTCNIFSTKGWVLYGTLEMTMAIPVHSQFNRNGISHSPMENIDTAYIQAPWLWFVGSGFGLQYNITNNVGVFAEPSIRYHIPTNSILETYYTENPFSFSLPIGIKIIW